MTEEEALELGAHLAGEIYGKSPRWASLVPDTICVLTKENITQNSHTFGILSIDLLGYFAVMKTIQTVERPDTSLSYSKEKVLAHLLAVKTMMQDLVHQTLLSIPKNEKNETI